MNTRNAAMVLCVGVTMKITSSLRAGSLIAALSVVGVAGSASAFAAVPPAEPVGSVDFPYEDFYAVPQLGAEEVVGTGCGGDGAIGDTIPDGIWRGHIASFDGPEHRASTSLEFNLLCVYSGATGERLRAEWQAANPGQEQFGFPDGFMVDNNPRTRTVPLAAHFAMAGAVITTLDRCAVPANPGFTGGQAADMWRTTDAWLVIENGEAVTAVTSCAAGGGEIVIGCWSGGYAEGFASGGIHPRCE